MPDPARPTDDDLLARARVSLVRGDLAGAELALAGIPAGSPLRAEALAIAARVALAGGRPEDAAGLARDAQRGGLRLDAAKTLAEALLAIDEPAEAGRTLELALGLAPDDVEAQILLGHAHGAQEQLRSALQCYQEALRLDDASTPARFYMAETLVRTGEIVRASTQLHMVLKRAPAYGPAYALRGDIALHHGDHRQAAADYCRAIELDAADAPIYERLGRAFRAIDDPGQALKALDGAIHLEPDSWDAYEAAAEICEAQGWIARARRYWDALTYVPGRREAALVALRRVVDAIAARDADASDPPGAPPEFAELTGFTPPPTLEAAPKPRPGSRFGSGPPPLAELLDVAAPAAPSPAGVAKDGFGTSGAAAGYLDAFRGAAPEPESPPPPPAPEPVADPVMEQLDALQAKLKRWLK